MNKILVIGEHCTDIFVYGSSTRKSPEGKGPILIPTNEVHGMGMAENTANNLKAMGMYVDGFYDNGNITKTRYVNETTNELYLRVDRNDKVPRINITNLPTFSQYAAVVISDYCKGFLTEGDIEYISKQHPLVILDTKKRLGEWCKHIKFIKLNRFEMQDNYEIILNNDWLKDKLIVTLDGNGAFYQDKVIKTEKVENADVSGAGDTFVAAFISNYISTQNVERSIEWGNYCAGEVVKEKGVTIFKG